MAAWWIGVRLVVVLAVLLSHTVRGDEANVASLSPEAVLPDGASPMNVGTGREPPNALVGLVFPFCQPF